MRPPRALAALVLSFSCAIGAASCVLEPDTDPETPQETNADDSAATAAITDDLGEAESALGELGARTTRGGDFGHLDLGGPRFSGGLNLGGPTMDASGNPVLLARCLNLARASVPEKEEFCRSLPDSGKRARCWKYRYSSLEWTGWCLFEFSD